MQPKKAVLALTVVILIGYLFLPSGQTDTPDKMTQGPIVTLGFQGPVSNSSKIPDPQIAAGLDRVLIATNQGMALYDKEGSLLSEGDLFRFFEPVLSSPQGVGDPRILFDRRKDRFFVAAMGNGFDFPDCVTSRKCVSNFLLAVSAGPYPEGFSEKDWHLWELPAGLDVTPEGRQKNQLSLDFTSLSVGRSAVVFTGHMLDKEGDGGDYAKIRTVPKRRVLRGKRLKPRHFSDYVHPRTSAGPEDQDVLVIQPVKHHDDTGTLFLTSSLTCDLVVWGLKDKRRPGKIRDLVWSPRASSEYPCEDNPDAPQRGSSFSVDLQTMGGLTERAVFRDDTLWVARSRPKKYPTGVSVVLQLLKFDLSGWPNRIELLEERVLESPELFRSYPAVEVDSLGNAVMVFGEFSGNSFPSIRLAWPAIASATLLSDLGLLKRGEAPIEEELPKGSGISRYGDYFGASVDPEDESFWVVGEYPIEGKWATWISRVTMGTDP